jgi:hypothetical protein
MRMVWGFGENILHNAFGKFTCTLILFQNDEHRYAGLDVETFLPIYGIHIVYGDAVVGVTVAVGGEGVDVIAGIVGGGSVFVGMVGTGVFVGRSVGSGKGVRLGVRVGSGVGVGRLKVRKTCFSA